MSIAQTYNSDDISNGVYNIIGAAIDKLQANIGLLILISIFSAIIASVAGFITLLLAFGKNLK